MAIPFSHATYILGIESTVTQTTQVVSKTETDPSDEIMFFGRVDPGFNGTINYLGFALELNSVACSSSTSVTAKWQISAQGAAWFDLPGFSSTTTWVSGGAALNFYDVFDATTLGASNDNTPFDIRLVISATTGDSRTYSVTATVTDCKARVFGDSE
jgi:hypothetical protein